MRHLAAVAVLLSSVALARAGTVVVPDDQPTIQEGIDAAADGDTVRVRRGEYVENVQVSDRSGLNLVFENGALLRRAVNGSTFELNGCTGIDVEGLSVEGSSSDGILLFDCDGVTLSRCEVVGTTGVGIYVEDSPRTRVERCSVYSVESYGILVDAGSVESEVTRCDVLQTDDDGIRVEADDVVVERCTVTDTGNFGIAMAPDSGITGVRIIRCRVDDTADDGIVVQGTGTFVDKCVVVDSGEDSIDVESEAVDCTVQRCKTIRGVWGMDVEGTGNTVSKNKHVKPTEVGIGVTGIDNEIVKGKVSKPGSTGIFVFDAASGNDIDRCGVKKAGDYGVVLEGSGNTLTRNKSTGSGEAGLDDRTDGGNTLTKNKLK